MLFLSKVVIYLSLCLAIYAKSSSLVFRDTGVKSLTDRGLVDGENIILSWGTLGLDDVLYFSHQATREASENDTTSVQLTYISSTKVTTYVAVYEEGESQNTTASISGGELGGTSISILIQSDFNRGYNVTIQIYGEDVGAVSSR